MIYSPSTDRGPLRVGRRGRASVPVADQRPVPEHGSGEGRLSGPGGGHRHRDRPRGTRHTPALDAQTHTGGTAARSDQVATSTNGLSCKQCSAACFEASNARPERLGCQITIAADVAAVAHRIDGATIEYEAIGVCARQARSKATFDDVKHFYMHRKVIGYLT